MTTPSTYWFIFCLHAAQLDFLFIYILNYLKIKSLDYSIPAWIILIFDTAVKNLKKLFSLWFKYKPHSKRGTQSHDYSQAIIYFRQRTYDFSLHFSTGMLTMLFLEESLCVFCAVGVVWCAGLAGRRGREKEKTKKGPSNQTQDLRCSTPPLDPLSIRHTPPQHPICISLMSQRVVLCDSEVIKVL